ncbi:MAG: ATP-binding protein [Bacteroidales bacterium]|nr:ATP-binding protein [Bacteroidales bacterium]
MVKYDLKRIIVDNINDVKNYKVMPRDINLEGYNCFVLVGVRRAGKSYMLYHKIQQLLGAGTPESEILYINFEDERLSEFKTEDFNLLLECHNELYGKRPILFLDEIQNIPLWEKFARRMADSGYAIFITGSNSKMLSGEVATTLGGRFIIREIYPYSLEEYLKASSIAFDDIAMLGTESRARIIRAASVYLHHGGLPVTVNLPVVRDYISSVYQKIYLGDIVQRNVITNVQGIKLMVKKMAESVCRPISYNRISNILSGAGGKISLATIIKYVDYCEDAWLLLRLKNYAARLNEKESNCKYYFIDNGILSLFLIDKDPMLLENMVALSLLRRYGHDRDNETVFFYNTDFEVDFYVPEDALAVQVCYKLFADEDTQRRELQGLEKIMSHVDCRRRIVVTLEEETTITDSNGTIEVIPFWKFLLK